MKKQIYKKDINDFTNTYGMRGCNLCGTLFDEKAEIHDCEGLKNLVAELESEK